MYCTEILITFTLKSTIFLQNGEIFLEMIYFLSKMNRNFDSSALKIYAVHIPLTITFFQEFLEVYLKVTSHLNFH